MLYHCMCFGAYMFDVVLRIRFFLGGGIRMDFVKRGEDRVNAEFVDE